MALALPVSQAPTTMTIGDAVKLAHMALEE